MELKRGVHPHQVLATSSSKHGLYHDKKPERVRGNTSTQLCGLCHSKKSEQAWCIASTQPNSYEMCIAFQMMVNEHKHLIKNKTGSIFQLIVGFKANANLEITNGIIFDKIVSHQVNVAMKHRINYNGNNSLQWQILPLILTHISNPISSLKFIGKLKLEGAGFAPTTFQAFKLFVALTSIDNFQLIVSVFLNSNPEGVQAPSNIQVY
jgi:hypothetical protein